MDDRLDGPEQMTRSAATLGVRKGAVGNANARTTSRLQRGELQPRGAPGDREEAVVVAMLSRRGAAHDGEGPGDLLRGAGRLSGAGEQGAL